MLMRKLSFGLVTCLLVIFFSLESYGQFNRKMIKRNNKRIASYTGKKKFGREHVYSGVGFSLNALNYYGDLSPLPSKFSTDISFTKPGLGISFFHRFGPRYTLVGQFMYGTLKGSDAESAKGSDGPFRKERNLSFRNRIKELSVTAYFDLFENNGTYISRVKWTPYVFIGLAAFLHNPQAQEPAKFLDGTVNPNAGKWVNLQPLGTEGQHSTLSSTDVNHGIKPYSLLQVAIPFGVGAKKKKKNGVFFFFFLFVVFLSFFFFYFVFCFFFFFFFLFFLLFFVLLFFFFLFVLFGCCVVC
ncbi:MAG TPA: hypothetical protein DGG95_11655, partial [Cytophagales bacterium]|nr:hypothetical protein [Cytophagales bacterium]